MLTMVYAIIGYSIRLKYDHKLCWRDENQQYRQLISFESSVSTPDMTEEQSSSYMLRAKGYVEGAGPKTWSYKHLQPKQKQK